MTKFLLEVEKLFLKTMTIFRYFFHSDFVWRKNQQWSIIHQEWRCELMHVVVYVAGTMVPSWKRQSPSVRKWESGSVGRPASQMSIVDCGSRLFNFFTNSHTNCSYQSCLLISYVSKPFRQRDEFKLSCLSFGF